MNRFLVSHLLASAILVVSTIAVSATAGAAELRFVRQAMTVEESAPAFVVRLEADFPECDGDVRLPEASVTLATSAGGRNPATAGADFALVELRQPVGGSGRPLVFERLLPGVVTDDDEPEPTPPETFLVTVEVPPDLTAECRSTGVAMTVEAGPPLEVAIVDDDQPPVVSFSQASDRVSEAAGSKSYALVRSQSARGAVSAHLTPSSERVTVSPDTLSWADGEEGERTFTAFIADDNRARGDETVTLSFIADGAVPGDPEVLTITLVDDDEEVSTIGFDRPAASVVEGGALRLALVRRGLEGAVRVVLATDDPTVELDPAALDWAAGEDGPRVFTARFPDDNLVGNGKDVLLSFTIVSGNARPAASRERLEVEVTDDDTAVDVRLVGGDNQLAALGEVSQPLEVQATNAAGEPVLGAEVRWTVLAGQATLTDGAVTTSASDGTTANRVVPTATGTLIVAAAVPGVEVDFVLVVDEELDPVTTVLNRACGERDDLDGVCGYYFDLTAGDKRALVDEIRPEEVAGQANVTQDAPRVQQGNVASRLHVLRGGASAPASVNVAMSLLGKGLDPGAVVNALKRRAFDPEDAVDAAFRAAVQDGDAPATAPPAEATIADTSRLGFFLNGSFALGERPGTSRETGLDFDTLGLTAGLDYRVGARSVLGGALGYLDTNGDLARAGGTLDSQGVTLSLYAMRYWDMGLYLQGVVGVGDVDYDLVRRVELPVPFRGKSSFDARGKTGGSQTSGAFELGWEVGRGSLTATGFGRLSWVSTDIDRYRETGDPDGQGFYLEVIDQTSESLLGSLGVDLSWALSTSWGVFLPQVRLAVLHEFDDESRFVRARFVEDTDPTNVFAIPTDEPDRDYLNGGVGFSFQLPRGISAFFFYDTDLGRDDLDLDTFTAGFRLEL